MSRFVVQKHHATRLHYDFRLEMEGVLKSWAIPKGLPIEPGTKRLAMQVPDHDLDYGSFEGQIPDGEYGAGQVTIWDEGTYTVREWTDRKISISLKGHRVAGDYELIRFSRAGEQAWLILKRGQKKSATDAE